ncbi:Dehydrogenase/reductase SDR family member 11 [Hypsibius exemplaris]|uniref:Dehydrogenase/reductase SDR family member 11 n=1 Tax=Hypsibius exemplaris TaxID=2072580 RepID=A0A1W0WUC8_HYPEX|nr:Dehydrogenase/reductase SDR family member 11 [Hypsibius exemplaris]
MERWSGRTALVTGASVGIGHAVAEALAKSGMNVVACARNVGKIEELAKSVGNAPGKIYPIKCDLTQETEILQMFKTIEEKFKHIDVLINNAGLAHPEDLLTGNTEKWKGMIDLNVLGLSICAREALRLMDKDNIDDGHIININSMAGHNIFASMPIIHFYMGTKHMVTALTKALNAELRQKKSKIRVTSLSPGAVQTEFGHNLYAGSSQATAAAAAFAQTFPLLTGKDIADAVLYVVGAPAHVSIHELIIAPTEQPVL